MVPLIPVSRADTEELVFQQGATLRFPCDVFFFFSLTFGRTGSSLLHVDFSLVAASGGHSPVVVQGLLVAVASLVVEHRPWGTWASVVVVHGLASLQHVGSSQTRD